VLENDLGRDMALRSTFVSAGVACALLLAYAIVRLRLD
jgi:hypothetical protein